MSTVTEIEAAIAKLSPEERESLESRLFIRHRLDDLDPAEHAELMASIDEAEAEIERGEGFAADEMRKALRSWTGG